MTQALGQGIFPEFARAVFEGSIDFVGSSASGFGVGPTGQLFCRRVQVVDSAVSVASNDPVTN